MPRATTWTSLSKDPVREAEEYVVDVVTEVRKKGHTRDVAISIVAERLGLSPRKVRSLHYGEHTAVSISLLDRIRIGVIRHLEAEKAETTRRLQMLHHRIEVIQNEMDRAGSVGNAGPDARALADARGGAAAATALMVAISDDEPG